MSTTTKKLASLEERIALLHKELAFCLDPERKADLEEEMELLQYDVDEINNANLEQQSYEEMTGTTPQDLYNERNSYALHQSDLIDQFRREI